MLAYGSQRLPNSMLQLSLDPAGEPGYARTASRIQCS